MTTGTTMSKAAEFKAKASMDRPATGGNKNLNSRARRSTMGSQMGATKGVTDKVLAGPDKGRG